MIVKIGNIFDSKATTLVNTVNCVGVMGKGVAFEFKKRFPAMFEEYRRLCSGKLIVPGNPYYYTDLLGTSVILFPTKDHWRSPSKLSYIVEGLKWFRNNYKELGITSVAFPPLGCGNGGLSWSLVGPVMYQMLSDLPIDVEVYAPFGTPKDQLETTFLCKKSVQSMLDVSGGKNISVNKYWLLLLDVIQKLNHSRYSLNVGRTIFQKVCYVVTRSGIPTGFHFVEGTYGPYSKEIKNVITALSNANLITEKPLGRMIEIVVSSDFILPKSNYTDKELWQAAISYDLLSRIKSTEQAEMIATVLFSYDELCLSHQEVTEQQIFDHVINWKKRWRQEQENREQEIISTIYDLSALGWMLPNRKYGTLVNDDDIY